MANASQFNLKNFYNILSSKTAILYAYQFVAEFNGLNPAFGITDSSDAAGNITYYIQSAKVPGTTLTQVKTAYLGTEFRTPGVKQFQHNWDCTILLTQDLTIYKGFRRWMDDISDFRNDGGGNKFIPNVNIRVSLLDPTSQQKTTSFVMEGVWPGKVGDITLEYVQGGGNPVNSFPITLYYQYCYKDDSFHGDSDPLKA